MKKQQFGYLIIFSTILYLLSFTALNNLIQDGSMADISSLEHGKSEEIGIEDTYGYTKAQQKSPNSANDINIQDRSDLFWNGTNGWESFIESDNKNNSLYILNQKQQQSPNKGTTVNISKIDIDTHQQHWNLVYGEKNQSYFVQDILLSQNKSKLYIFEVIFNKNPLNYFNPLNYYNQSRIISINATNGNIIKTINMSKSFDDKSLFINSMKNTGDNGHVLLNGIIYNNENSTENTENADAILSKYNLYSERIIWKRIWGEKDSDEELIGFDLTNDGEYIYTIGYQYNSTTANPMALFNVLKPDIQEGKPFFLQISETGFLYFEKIMKFGSDTTFMPKGLSLDNKENHFFVLSSYKNSSESGDSHIGFSKFDLVGNIVNHTIYQDENSFTYEKGTKLLKSPWNQSYYILANSLHKDGEQIDSISGILLQVHLNGSLIWKNITYLPDIEENFNIYNDFVSTNSNNFLRIIGYKTIAQNETYAHLFEYSLNREPAPSYLYSEKIVDYDGQIDLNWTEAERAHNYSIFRKNTPFSDINDAEMLTITEDLSFTDQLNSNGSYYYSIISSNEYGNSTPSNILEIKEAPDHTPFLYEASIRRRNSNDIGSSGFDVILNWTECPDGDLYYIYKNQSKSFDISKTNPIQSSTENNFIDLDIEPGEWWYAIICEYDGHSTNSSLSNNRSISTINYPENPYLIYRNRPYLNSTDIPTYDQFIELNWSYSKYTNNYSIHRDVFPFQKANQTNQIDKNLQNNSYIDTLSNEGLYYYMIVAHNGSQNISSNVLETLRAPEPTPYLYEFSNSTTTQKDVKLRWSINNKSGQVDPNKYYIYRNDSKNFNILYTSPITEVDGNKTSYLDENVPDGTWYYRLYLESSLSNIQSITVTSESLMPNFTINPYIIKDMIHIKWQNIPNTESYEIYRTLSPINTIGELRYFSPIGITDENEYTDNPPNENLYYWYVIARNGSGISYLSNQISEYIFEPLETPFLEGPTENVTDSQVILDWDPIKGVEYYFIFRNTSFINNISQAQNLGVYGYTTASKTDFTDVVEKVGNYHYAIIGWKNPGIITKLSNVINVSVQDLPKKVSKVTFNNRRMNLEYNQYNNIIGDRFVNLTWESSSGSLYYEIYRSQNKITDSLNGATKLGKSFNLWFMDFDITNNEKFFYTVVGINHTGYAEPADCINATMKFTSNPITFNLSQSSNRSILIEFSNGTYISDGDYPRYYIYRASSEINETNWDQIKEDHEIETLHNPENFFYIDRDLPTQTKVFYVIVLKLTYKDYGDIEFWSNVSLCHNISLINTPFQPHLQEVESPQYHSNITIEWTDFSLNTNFSIYRQKAIFSEKDLSSLTPIEQGYEGNIYNDINLPSGDYYYGIMARNNTGNSTLSNIIHVKIVFLPHIPQWTTQNSTIFVNSVNISWIDIHNYNNYSIYRGNTSKFNDSSTTLLLDSYTNTEFLDRPQSEIMYYYWVFAHNGSGRSNISARLEIEIYKIPAVKVNLIPNEPIINHTAVLKWKKVNHATTYHIYRSNNRNILNLSNFYLSLDSYAKIDVNGDSNSFLEYFDNQIPLGRYYYRFVPVFEDENIEKYGNASEILMVRVEDPPQPPEILSITEGSFDSINISWSKLDNVDYYVVYMSNTPINSSVNLSEIKSSPLLENDTNSYVFQEIGYGLRYFMVRSVNETGMSEFSEIKTYDNSSEKPDDNMNLIIGVSVGIFSAVVSTVLYKYYKERKDADPENLF